MKIVKPKISKYLDKVILNEDITMDDLIDIEVENQEIDFKIKEREFNGCRFINVDFSLFPLENISLIDCIFECCNLSGCDFSGNSIHRVKFDRCNMVGCNFILSSIKDVSVFESKGNYINFSDSKIKYFEIVDSVFKEGRFVSTKFEDCVFDKVNFEGCEFLNTSLKGIDFSSCIIDGIGVRGDDIRGMIVNDSQALMLIGLFGIVVK